MRRSILLLDYVDPVTARTRGQFRPRPFQDTGFPAQDTGLSAQDTVLSAGHRRAYRSPAACHQPGGDGELTAAVG
ncbi:hypothetical protein GCM10022233_63790 [Streptomyces shaanxiensis]|uniref:Uncharacterized protein n=1 Tax=Streptomyces shaanxiensis TaxID=653357 RepID=A0ABP7VX39_9ACTN